MFGGCAPIIFRPARRRFFGGRVGRRRRGEEGRRELVHLPACLRQPFRLVPNDWHGANECAPECRRRQFLSVPCRLDLRFKIYDLRFGRNLATECVGCSWFVPRSATRRRGSAVGQRKSPGTGRSRTVQTIFGCGLRCARRASSRPDQGWWSARCSAPAQRSAAPWSRKRGLWRASGWPSRNRTFPRAAPAR